MTKKKDPIMPDVDLVKWVGGYNPSKKDKQNLVEMISDIDPVVLNEILLYSAHRALTEYKKKHDFNIQNVVSAFVMANQEMLTMAQQDWLFNLVSQCEDEVEFTHRVLGEMVTALKRPEYKEEISLTVKELLAISALPTNCLAEDEIHLERMANGKLKLSIKI